MQHALAQTDASAINNAWVPVLALTQLQLQQALDLIDQHIQGGNHA